MPLTFALAQSGIPNCKNAAYSNIFITPIVISSITSTVIGQIVLVWTGGLGNNVKYSYALSVPAGTATISSVNTTSSSGTNTTTLTLSTTASIVTTVTITGKVLDGNGSTTSASVTTKVYNAVVLSTGTNSVTNDIAYTTDGINYTTVTAGTNKGNYMTGFGGVLCTTGNVYGNFAFSNDAGNTWTLASKSGLNLGSIIYFKGKYYTGGYNFNTGMYYTTTPADSASWTTITLSHFMVNTFFACTLNGTPILIVANDLFNVYNGQTYNGFNSSGPDPLYYSTDGTTFTQCSSPASPFYRIGGSNSTRQTFASNGSMIVAIGSTASGASQINTAAYSTNGSSWTTCSFSPALAGGLPFAIAYGGGLWMAVMLNSGVTKVYTSTDGMTFNTSISTPIDVIAINYINGTWIIANGGNSPVYYSTNAGATWTASSVAIRNVTTSSLVNY